MTDVRALMAANGGKYDMALDPTWNEALDERPPERPFQENEIAFYQCDHLGTPQEVTDAEGNIAWSAQYKAWGEAKEVISEAARKAGISNPIRFQGQYFDEETGLHYNRYRYYDPHSGRFISRDPFGLRGDINLHRHASNPINWIDPFGLTGVEGDSGKLAEARSARDALSVELAPMKGKAPATVTGGYNVKTGDVAARACGGGKCAEDHVVDALGGEKNDVRFTEATRPRTGLQVPVCPRCEGKYGRGPFPIGTTRFKTDEE
jgi:RHS repeat-associated protein